MTRFLFRITHSENVGTYLKEGVIRAKDVPPLQAGFRVSDAGIISRRGVNISQAVGFSINDYVPFYFSPLTSMAFKISKGNVKVVDPRNREIGNSKSEDMVFIVAKVDEVAKNTSYKFTDAACNTAIPPNIFDDIQLLEKTVHWSLFDDGSVKGKILEIGYQGSTKYCTDHDGKARYHNRTKLRMAEFMVHKEFPMSLCRAIITCNSETEKIIEGLVSASQFRPLVLHKRDCFFP